jgi:hypothetical protein
MFLDCEASGWPPDGVAIEIAWGAPGGEIVSYLVKPNWRWTHWSEQAEAVHGIPRETLERNGIEAREIAMLMNTALDGRIVYTDAPEFDAAWISPIFDVAEINPTFDFADAHSVIPDVPGRMPELIEKARTAAGGIHRAAMDVRFLIELYTLARQAAKS